MHRDSFPYLSHLLGAYFHQDAYANGESDEDIVQDFCDTSGDAYRQGTIADIRHLLREHESDLAEVVTKTFSPEVDPGETNAEVRAWLSNIERLLAGQLAP